MSDNRKRIQEYVNQHRDELVMDMGFELCRLLGWTDDADDEDYYYILWSTHRKKLILSTCVGRIISLKGIDHEDYQEIERVWSLNYPTIPDLEKELETQSYSVL